jgi:hypothetical protein
MPTNDELKNEYFVNATQYYAAGRFAAIGQLSPIAGLLCHYALEMFLKGHLCLTLTEQERKSLSHRLEEEVWPAFKNMIHASDLDRYDSVITAIDVFWDLRYPEDFLQTGKNPKAFQSSVFGEAKANLAKESKTGIW